jgi:hypothetical protein
VNAFAPDLKVLLTGKARTNSDLVGRWSCTWLVREQTREEMKIGDIVRASRVFQSVGRKALGNRRQLNATREEMNGYWYEYGREERIVGGPAVWKRNS